MFDEQAVFAAGVNDLDWNRLEASFGCAPKMPRRDLLGYSRGTLCDERGTERPRWPVS